jgi:hypothetical protein
MFDYFYRSAEEDIKFTSYRRRLKKPRSGKIRTDLFAPRYQDDPIVNAWIPLRAQRNVILMRA